MSFEFSPTPGDSIVEARVENPKFEIRNPKYRECGRSGIPNSEFRFPI